jgi:hypothetical protein
MDKFIVNADQLVPADDAKGFDMPVVVVKWSDHREKIGEWYKIGGEDALSAAIDMVLRLYDSKCPQCNPDLSVDEVLEILESLK